MTNPLNEDYHGIDIIFMTAIRCGALLYTYHQFQILSRLGSKYLFGIAAIIVVFSSAVFCCTVLKLLDCDISDLKDAVFFFLLLIDLNKARFLAQYALDSSSYKEVQDNIAEGLSLMGPTLTLDTIAEALLIGAGTLSVAFENIVSTQEKNISKIIMSAGLFLVHGITRWSFDPEKIRLSVIDLDLNESFQESTEPPFIVRWLNAGLDHAVILVILGVLLIKFTFFENFGILRENTQFGLEKKKNSLEGGTKKSANMTHVFVQTEPSESVTESDDKRIDDSQTRSLEECLKLSQTDDGIAQLNDEELLLLLENNSLPHRTLERRLNDTFRAVSIRRSYVSKKISDTQAFSYLPYKDYNYEKVLGTCCENVIGYVPVPVGVAGPLKVNGTDYMIPLATTEGALVASTSRGCKAITKSNGAKSLVYKDGMSRGPVVELPSAAKAIEVSKWIKNKDNYSLLEESFNSTSNFARLVDIHPFHAARFLFLRFEATTGDAMGMNMVAKGTEASLVKLKQVFPEMEVVSISGNVCTDKKPSAINWILGRGKSVVCEATIPAATVETVLKTTTKKLVETNEKKNYIGSSIAGSIGGNNAHAANIIAALFIACGQDPAQVVESCSCITVMERTGELEKDLYASVTMPCIEVGTVGGGTTLPPQAACLSMLGVKGPSKVLSGEHASKLATIAAATVLAAELSLMASLSEQTLVSSHLTLNRRPKPAASSI
ncbi:3-hydroxy-3-methylglutaryl-coenzyme A reductase [Armadillidium nasatum]|uniref:3-hydroxy-3-methylglutaryl coenzyme A reductase n=1 Tax=Armadillidium nasatum TaxID=96803 RepID=A0A5N5T9H5_9CRUS|nr:3-hydroxy-3-methylglutaryl-coenzyme A reductase [Armadillidium nasatum]